MNSRRLNPVIQLPRRRMATVFMAAALWTGSLAGAKAELRPSLELIAPEQAVVIGTTGALFEADVLIGANGQTCGFVNFALRDGTLIELEPIYGIVEQHRRATNGETQTVEFNDVGVSLVLIPTVGPPSAEVGCAVGIHAPRQTVIPFEAVDPLDFSANVRVERNHAAHGVVYAPLSDRGGLYRIFFGIVLPHAEREFQIFLVGVRPDTPEWPTTDDFLRVAVFPSGINPECQIWDLINGDSGAVQNTAMIEAETDLRFHPSPRR